MNALRRQLCATALVAAFTIGPGLLAGLAAASSATVPAELAALLRTLPAEPASAAQRLRALRAQSAPHPLLDLALGQAELRQAIAIAAPEDANRLAHLAAADLALRHAIASDPQLREAHASLARCAALRSDWPTALTAAAAVCAAQPSRDDLRFLAEIAWQAGDLRLALLSAQQGLLRYPDDLRFRRLELACLLRVRSGGEALAAARALTALTPHDAQAYADLAAAAERAGATEEAIAALEAALLLAPERRDLRLALATWAVHYHQPRRALAVLAPLLAQHPVDPDLARLGCGAALANGDPATARSHLDRIPPGVRNAADARLRTRLDLALGEADPAVLAAALDAGALTRDDVLPGLSDLVSAWLTVRTAMAYAERDLPRTEQLLHLVLRLPAAARDAQLSATATAHLVTRALAAQRRAEAAHLLAAHLARWPGDADLRALLNSL